MSTSYKSVVNDQGKSLNWGQWSFGPSNHQRFKGKQGSKLFYWVVSISELRNWDLTRGKIMPVIRLQVPDVYISNNDVPSRWSWRYQNFKRFRGGKLKVIDSNWKNMFCVRVASETVVFVLTHLCPARWKRSAISTWRWVAYQSPASTMHVPFATWLWTWWKLPARSR